jgi:hypothetical protein
MNPVVYRVESSLDRKFRRDWQVLVARTELETALEAANLIGGSTAQFRSVGGPLSFSSKD